jgi:arginase
MTRFTIQQSLGAGVNQGGNAQGFPFTGAFFGNADSDMIRGLIDNQPAIDHSIVGRAALLHNLSIISARLQDHATGPLLVVGGDCSVDLTPIASQHHRFGSRLHVAYFDAHADLNTPTESPSGALHGMVVRHLLGEGDDELCTLLGAPLEPTQLTYFGVRTWDDTERRASDRHQLSYGTIGAAIDAEAVHVHLDLDVLDPNEFSHTTFPEPGGPSINAVASAIGALSQCGQLASITITESAVTNFDQLQPLQPIADAINSWLHSANHP